MINLTIQEFWKTLRHNIKLLPIRTDVNKNVLKQDYNDILSFLDKEGNDSIEQSILFYQEHPELENKITECMGRYEKNFKSYNSDPMDISKALALIDFVKCFPKYIDFDLHTKDLENDAIN